MAGAGTAVHSKVNGANSWQGRGDITKAMGELTLFLEVVAAPQMLPHLLGTQGSRAASPQSRLGWGAAGWWEPAGPRAEPIVPLLLQQVGAPVWTGTAPLPFGLGWPHMVTALHGSNLPALI